MIVFTTMWLLVVVTPLCAARSVPDAGQRVSTGGDDATSRSLSERFLQITRKSCRGPEGQAGTCMFNYQCQQIKGQVVGACLDGFLFGACCHQQQPTDVTQSDANTSNESVDHSNEERDEDAVSSSTTTTTTLPPKPTTPDYVTMAPGLESSILMTNTIPTALSAHQESNQSGHYDVSHHLPLVLMFLNKTSVNYVPPAALPLPPPSGGGGLSDEHDDWADDNSRQPTTESAIKAQIDAVLSTETLVSTTTATTTTSTTQKPASSTLRPNNNRPKPGGKRPRPKPKTTTTTTTTEAPTSTTSQMSSTTTTAAAAAAATTEASEAAEATDITEQHANNVLQFLVSNPPAWVLEELMNSNASLTTWYPLPIPESHPASPDAQPVTRPVKRKPVKIRPTTESATSTTESTTTASTTTTTTTTTTTRKPRPVFDYAKDCGVRPMVPTARIVGGRRSDYGRWPWQVLVRESTWFGIFSKNKCGGVLISDRHVLTAAHCQPGFLGSLMVVLGEYELTSHTEPNTPVEKHVKRVVVHRDYVERTFENDLAILELDSPVEFKPYIVPICLPSTSEGDFIGRKAEVTGWGKLSHNGPTPGVLHEVDVPIMSNNECHDMFKKAGHEKRILDSFVCAGYSEGKKDSCEGDSGGPLMIERDDGRWELVGTVSHGIRCAYPNMPGVYMRMTYYRPWIERVTGVGGPQLG